MLSQCLIVPYKDYTTLRNKSQSGSLYKIKYADVGYVAESQDHLSSQNIYNAAFGSALRINSILWTNTFGFWLVNHKNQKLWLYQLSTHRYSTQNRDPVTSTKYPQIYNTKQRSDHIYQVLSDIQHKTEIWSHLPSTLRYTTQNRDLVISTKYSEIYNTQQRSGHIHQVLSDIQHNTEIWSYL